MKPNPDYQPLLSEKFLQMKRTLYIKLFKALIVVFLMMPIIELFPSFGAENLQSFIPSIFIAICGLTAIQIILKIQHNQELIITIFFILLHSACILIFFKWDPQMYNSSPNSYFAGSVNPLSAERINIAMPIKDLFRA